MGRIHPHVEYEFLDGHPELMRIVKPFLSCFDVSKAFWQRRGTKDRIICFFLKAEQFMKDQLGIERELLLVYSPFQEFQARSIELHDIVTCENRIRLDPLGSIIISDDPNIQDKIREYMVTDLERPPIVAIYSGDLDSMAHADDLRRIFFNQLFNRDLFGLESPLRTDITFFGRTQIVTELIERFRTGQNSGLFGLRRIGKTSVLYAIMRQCNNGCISGTAYQDMSNPAVYKSHWYALLQELVIAFAKPLNLKRGDRSKVKALTIEYSDTNAARHAKNDLELLANKYPQNRLLFLLDEIENITFDISPACHWQDEFLPFWQTIRSIHQDTQGRIGFIVAGVNPHILEVDRVSKYDNPLFSTTHAFYLPPFDLNTVREMIRKIGRHVGLRFQETIYNRIFEEYGGHPFLVRQACSYLSRIIKERPADVPSSLFERDREAISLELNKNVRQILNVLAIWYPDEYELVERLAHGDKDTFIAFTKESATFTQHVEGYGLVRNARTDPKLLIGLVRAHLAKSIGVPKDVLLHSEDYDSMLAEISRRRNAIEIKLRTTISEGLRYQYGNKAAQKALNALSELRKTRLLQYSYNDMWDEMYFSDLISIMSAEWGAFDLYFTIDKDQFMKWLTHIDRCRSDAHAKKLSEEDLQYLRTCFKRLEEKLELNIP